MGILSGIGALVFVVAALQAAPVAKETLAEPLHRIVPDYPSSCRPGTDEALESQRVTVNFSVTRDGKTENVRVVETTNACFDETAIAAVRTWTYEPRRVDGVRQAQEDVEVTITFVLEEPTQTDDYDARPVFRLPPKYPRRCLRGAEDAEYVLVEFDVTVEGTTENISTADSSNNCFDRAAEKAVEEWRYKPRSVAGKPAVRKGVQTQITFQISGRSELKFRRTVRNRLAKVQRIVRKEGRAEEALQMLDEIEAEYGDTFSSAELASFHRLRAVARIETGDYKGALDDLRIVQRAGMTGEAGEPIAKVIEQLEAVIAAQEAAGVSTASDAEKAGKTDAPED